MKKQKIIDDEVPEQYICPISFQIMKNPVMIQSGHSFEKKEIQEWFKNHNTNPKTNLAVKNKQLIPNHALRNAIDSFFEKKEKTNRIKTNIQIQSKVQDQSQTFIRQQKRKQENYHHWYQNAQKKLQGFEEVLEFPQGMYKGQIRDQKPHGDGIMNYKTDLIYAGQWENGVPNGYGRKTIEQENYSGEWKNNQLQGIGWITNRQKKGIIYRGNFFASKRNGFGISYENNKQYYGNWQSDQKHGKGREKDKENGSVYSGNWKKGEKDGMGMITRGQDITEQFWIGGHLCQNQKQYWACVKNSQLKQTISKKKSSDECCSIF